MADANTKIDIKGLPQFIRALNKIQSDFEPETEKAAQDIARMVVAGGRGNARTPQARLAASSLNAGVENGAGTVRSNSPIFTGAEFGGRMRPVTMQFPPHRGKRGYFLYPWMRANAQKLNDRWDRAIADAMEPWDYP